MDNWASSSSSPKGNWTSADHAFKLKPELISKDKCFNGFQYIYKHQSKETKCSMKFSIYIPCENLPNEKFNALFFLSGIMCNEQNFLFKTGFQRYASECRIIVVGTDTSPRNVPIPGDQDSILRGRSAGWYLDATEEPWNENYRSNIALSWNPFLKDMTYYLDLRMYSYVTVELPEIIRQHFPVTGKFGIAGHSMGGNGALVTALRNVDLFQTISLFAPSCNPTSWGHDIIYKPFLGDDKESWKKYDAYEVAKTYNGPLRKILVDCGSEDEYLNLLLPEKLVEVAKQNDNLEVEMNMRADFNHSYFFVATFIENHCIFHASALSLL